MLGSMLSLIFLTINISMIVAQVAGPGKCPKVESKKDFNLDKFLGKWYEMAKFFTLFEIKCSEATYTKDSTTGQVKVNNKGIERVPPPEMFMPPPVMKRKMPPHAAPQQSLSQDSSPTSSDSRSSSRRRRRREEELQSSAIPSVAKGKLSNLPPVGQYPLKDLPKIELVDIPTEADADIAIADPNEPAKFTLNFTKGPQTDFQIVDTDYTTYAIIWSCHDIMFEGAFNAQFSSILSRQRTLDDETLEKAKKKMSTFGIDIQRFEMADQKNCPDEIKVPGKVQGNSQHIP